MSGNNCATCRWWKILDGDLGSGAFGRCHANPPQLDNIECDQYYGLFPKIHGDEFCGQWKEREDESEEIDLDEFDTIWEKFFTKGKTGDKEPSKAFFEALWELFVPPTEEQRAKAEGALRELLGEWKRKESERIPSKTACIYGGNIDSEIERIKDAFMEIVDPHIKRVVDRVESKTSEEFNLAYYPNFIGEFGDFGRNRMREVISDGPIETVHPSIPQGSEVIWMHRGIVLFLDFFPGTLERHLCGRMIYRRASQEGAP